MREERGSHSRLGGSGSNKQRELTYQACLCHKRSRPPHPSARILKVYTAAVTGFSHIFLLMVSAHVALSRLSP